MGNLEMLKKILLLPAIFNRRFAPFPVLFSLAFGLLVMPSHRHAGLGSIFRALL